MSRSSEDTKAVILRAAREHSAADGYDRTTIRAIAATAGIEPSMVMRCFGSKQQLFATAAGRSGRVRLVTAPARRPTSMITE